MTSTKQLLSSRIAVFTVVLAAILSVCAICFGAHQTAWADDPDPIQLIGADGQAIPETDATVAYNSDSKTITITAMKDIPGSAVLVYADKDAAIKLIDNNDQTVESISIEDGKIAKNSPKTIKLADETIPVKVVIAPIQHTINVTTDDNGTASADFETAAQKMVVTLSATPNTGYQFDKWESADVTVEDNNTFEMPDKNVTVKATFKAAAAEPYKVNIGEVENGTVDTDVTTAKVGDTVTITATPDKGYKLVDDIPVVVRDDDDSKVDVANVDGTFTFSMPESDVTVSASFQKEEAKKYSITIEAENGKVEASAEKAAEGVIITLTPKANDGYEFASWKSDQVKVDKNNQFVMPNKDVKIVANFIAKDTPKTTFEIVVSKTDAKTGAPLSGAEFELKDADKNVLYTWTTDGSAVTYKLDQGTKYILSETKAPEGYSREKDINIVYTDGKVMIDQGAKAVELKKNDDGYSTLNVKDMNGSGIHANTTSPKTGDNAMPMVIGAIVVVAAAVVGFAAYRKSKANKQQ